MSGHVCQVWMDVYALPVPGAGGKTCAQIFEEAGCDTPTSPSCGACLGGPADTYARLNEPQVRNRFLPYLSGFFFFLIGLKTCLYCHYFSHSIEEDKINFFCD